MPLIGNTEQRRIAYECVKENLHSKAVALPSGSCEDKKHYVVLLLLQGKSLYSVGINEKTKRRCSFPSSDLQAGAWLLLTL